MGEERCGFPQYFASLPSFTASALLQWLLEEQKEPPALPLGAAAAEITIACPPATYGQNQEQGVLRAELNEIGWEEFSPGH